MVTRKSLFGSNNISWFDRNPVFIVEKTYQTYNIQEMSYIFYFQSPNIPPNYLENEVQKVPQGPTYYIPIPSAPSYQTQNYFYPQNYTLNPGSITYTDFPYMPSQQDFSIPTSHSLPQIMEHQQNRDHPRKRERNWEKQIESAKKNSESNLINHFFSFFNSREKSQKMVQSCIASINKIDSHKEKLLHLFYNTVHVMNNRRGRGYVNKKNLLHLFEPTELLSTVPEIRQRISKISQITVDELCQVFRKCCFSFYRTYSIDSILTSKRISCVAKQQHFRKRRKVIKAFFENQ